MAKELLHCHTVCMHGCACAFVVVGMACTKQVSWAPEHVQVCTLYRCRLILVYCDTGVGWYHCPYLWTHSPQGVHVRSCMRSLFISVQGQGQWTKQLLRIFGPELIRIKAGLDFVRNECAYSVESSSQGISSNLLLWKRKKMLVVIQTWSWCGKPAACARAWLQEQTLSASIAGANAER